MASVVAEYERVIAACVHGRYLTIPPAAPAPAPLLLGFNGYGEGAEEQLERLRSIPESADWLCVSIEALHPFYQRRTNHVVANWMTRRNRELAIADNTAYVRACIGAVANEWPTTGEIVCSGFSQGVAMAFRAAVSAHAVAGVIAAGGDIPPELTFDTLKRIPAALIARGTSDEWYTAEKFAADERRLRDCSVSVTAIEFNGGHEWSKDVTVAASRFLREVRASHRR